MNDMNDMERSVKILSNAKFTGKQSSWATKDIETVLTLTKLEPNWTDDDAVECFVRITEMKTQPASKFWRFDRFNHCWTVKIVDEPTTTTIPSLMDPEVESIRLQECFRAICEANPIGYCPIVQVTSATSFAINFNSGWRSNVRTRVYDRAFHHAKSICGGDIHLVYDAVCGQINEEKRMCGRQQSVHTGSQQKKEDDLAIAQPTQTATIQSSEIQASKHKAATTTTEQRRDTPTTELEKIITDLSRKIEMLEKRTTEIATKLQFETLLKEIQRKQFGDVLIQIALTARIAKAERLGFGRVLQEMKQRCFGQLVVDISAAKRIAKTSELTRKMQLLQLEAERAGISLGALDSVMVFPAVTLMTGEISVDARDVPMAIPVSKTL